MKKIDYTKLLNRKQIIFETKEPFNNKTILVTGGGGSIGSEIWMQLAESSAEKIIIVDNYENTTFETEQEIKRLYPNSNYKIHIVNVQDEDLMEEVFKEENPDIIFHAAAHKHVPLMEGNPIEAVKNNCMGTYNLVKLADKYKVSKFILISTDKAVNPVSVMGQTKRICEMIIQTWNEKSKTDYVAVRFGNVLGSHGSVVPLFQKQIERGGPVTVTHKEVTRFFMTIPEAVSLVLTASIMARGGEIFILDMGKRVNIYNLAKKLIKLSGMQNIKINITGLRPGEKLKEELLLQKENVTKTNNNKIYVVNSNAIGTNNYKKIMELFKNIKNGIKPVETKKCLKEICK